MHYKQFAFPKKTLFLMLSLSLFIPISLFAQNPVKKTVWRIENARIIDTGTTVINNSGAFTRGHTIVADIFTEEGAAPFAKGKFILLLDTFSPLKDHAGQKAGMWYVQGTWTVTDEDKAARGTDQGAQAVKGTIAAELPFNPLVRPQTFEASVHVLGSPEAPQWEGSKGTFDGNGTFEGVISLEAERDKRALGTAKIR